MLVHSFDVYYQEDHMISRTYRHASMNSLRGLGSHKPHDSHQPLQLAGGIGLIDHQPQVAHHAVVWVDTHNAQPILIQRRVEPATPQKPRRESFIIECMQWWVTNFRIYVKMTLFDWSKITFCNYLIGGKIPNHGWKTVTLVGNSIFTSLDWSP